jgi:hypothetical protein
LVTGADFVCEFGDAFGAAGVGCEAAGLDVV